MSSYILLCGSIVVGLALITDPAQTIKLGASIITIRGATFLAQRITITMNKDSSDIINMVGWCIAGISIINFLKLSTAGITTVADSFDKFKNTMTGIGMYFEKFATIIEKITFWN